MKDLMNVMQDLTQSGTQVGCTDGCMLTDGYACVNQLVILLLPELAQKHVEMECLMLEKNVIQVPTMKP